jgi:hypothetical protein
MYTEINSIISSCESLGLSKCFEALSKITCGYVCSVGFNASSGSIYIALDCGVDIVSTMGKEVQYYVTNLETGEEHDFSDFHEAKSFAQKLQDELDQVIGG